MIDRVFSPRRLRRTTVSAFAAAAAATLTGCVAIQGTSTTQPESMGPVTLTVSACADGSPGCTATSNTGSLYEVLGSSSIDVQLLLAVRLPEGSTPPASLIATRPGGGWFAFSRSASYEAELQAFEPAPDGERWWGWISQQGSYSQATGQSFTVTIETTLPRPADGGPSPSPLRWRPVVGGRAIDGSLPPTRPVDCGSEPSDLYEGFSETNSAGRTITCIDSPSAESARGFLDAAVTDFGITAANVTVPAGSTVPVTFLARRSGAADAGTTFALSATTGIPGGSVSLDQQSVSLGGDAAKPVLATVAVPAGTPGGSYPVTLTATAAGKPTRTQTATVTVPGAGGGPGGSAEPGAAPTVRATLAPRRFRAGARVVKPRRGTPVGARLTVEVSKRARLTVAVERKVRGRKPAGKRCSRGARAGKRCSTFERVGSLKARDAAAGKTTIAFPGRLAGRKLAPGSYRFVVVATDSERRASAPARPAFTVVAR